MAPRPRPPIDRFIEKVEWSDDQWFDNGFARTPCLVWTSGKRKGYGRFRTGGAGSPSVAAHRWLYEYCVGPIPPDKDLDHRCHNGTSCPGGPTCPHRACVNPLHMRPLDLAANVLAGEGRTARQARSTHCTNSHAWTHENTLYRKAGGRSCRACIRERSRQRETRLKGVRREPKISHCKNGHELSGDNVHYPPDGKWQCRACRRDINRRQVPKSRAKRQAKRALEPVMKIS